MKIRKGDTVAVIKGADRGKIGKVLTALPHEGKVVIDGVNIRVRHRKPRMKGEKGEREKKPMPVEVSNVSLIDPGTQKPTRVGYVGTGKAKERVARKSGMPLKVKAQKKKKTKEAV